MGDFGGFLVAGLEGFFLTVPDAAEFPSVEEGCPVDVFGKFPQRLVFDDAGASELGLRGGVEGLVDVEFVSACVGEGDGCLFFFVEVGAEFLVAGFVFSDEVIVTVLTEQGGGDGN